MNASINDFINFYYDKHTFVCKGKQEINPYFESTVMHETGKGDYVNRTLMRDLFNRRLGILKLFLSELLRGCFTCE